MLIILIALSLIWISCSENSNSITDSGIINNDKYTIDRTLADGGQQNTIAFDGLAFLTNNLGAQSFLPPGKVADFSGFQYLRDNDLTQMGHNTDFVTIIAYNVLHILNDEQLSQMVERAEEQVELINEYTIPINVFR